MIIYIGVVKVKNNLSCHDNVVNVILIESQVMKYTLC